MQRKRTPWAAATILLAGIVACSTLKTTSGWDEHADFSKYKTWDWKDDGSIRDSVWKRRVQAVLEDELAKRGVRRVEADPDLWVVVHARISAETRVDSFSPGWGYVYGAWAAPTMTTIYEIPVGSIIIDLVDAKKKELVWRSTASDAIRAGKENAEREQRFVEIVDGLFASYPPPTKPAS